MVFPDKKTDGAMNQELIVTMIKCPETDYKQHADKVTRFNEEHNVFFTQETTTVLSEKGVYVYTSLLYADGRLSKLPNLG